MNPHPLVVQTIMRLLLKGLPAVLIVSLACMPATPVGSSSISANSDNGEFIWAKALGGAGANDEFGDVGFSVFADEAGNVYTTGWFEGTADFDPGEGTYNLTSAGRADIFVSKLDSAGKFVWAKALGGEDVDGGYSIFVDGVGNVYTTGFFYDTADFDPGPGTFNLTSADGSGVFVSKLNSAGEYVWAKALGGNSGTGIFVDEQGGVYTTGDFAGTADFDPGPGTFNLTSAGYDDIFISKLDSAGEFAWAKALGGSDPDYGSDIFVDSLGNVYTTGWFWGKADFDPGAGSFDLASAGGVDIFVSKLDGAGNFVWAKAMGGRGHDGSYGVFADEEGNTYTSGWFERIADFDPGEGTFNLTSAGWADIFVSKLDSAGDFIWAKALGGKFSDESYGIFVDGAGNVYTTGGFRSNADFDPGVGTFNLTTAGKADVFISKLDSAGDFVWAKAMGGAYNDGGVDIIVDGMGNVYTTGSFNSTADFDPGPDTFNLTSAGVNDIFISKLGVAARIAVTNRAVRSGRDITITLTIENQGPADAGGAQVSIPAPANATHFSWTCAASGGAACPTAGGSGDISHNLPAFPAGGEITYTASGEIINPFAPVAGRGSLTPPQGVNFTGSPTFHFGEYWTMTLPMIFVNASS